MRKDCIESKLSPDGSYLACIDTALSANLIHVPTGERVFQKKEFYQLNWSEYRRWLRAEDDDWQPLFRINFTPDSSTAIFSRSNHFRIDAKRVSIGSGSVTHDTTLAINTMTRKPIDLGGEVDELVARSYAFLDASRVIGMPTAEARDAGIFSFPDGKRLKKFDLYANEIHSTGNPDLFIIRPLRHTSMGVFDARTAQIAIGLNKEDAGIWKNQFIFESLLERLSFAR